ncbi:MAG: hypothetical protein H6Q73_3036 [Firmicutes bacterium]|nr:hypothetical protein [Bacillota bacterium]
MSKQNFLVTLAALTVSLAGTDTTLINVTLGSMTQAFPGVDPVLISLVATLPALLMIPIPSIGGRLCYYYDKKKLLVFSMILYIISGVGGYFCSESIYLVLASRAFIGIAAGIAATVGLSIIPEIYDEEERAKIYGWNNAFNGGVSTVLTMAAGALAAIQWNYAFLAYLAFIVVLFIQVLALPSMPPERIYKDEVTENVKKEKLGITILVLVVCLFGFMMISFINMMKLPIAITEGQIGDPMTVANAYNVYNITVIVMGIIFMKVFKTFKDYTLVICVATSAIAFFIVGTTQNVNMIYIASVCNGIAGGTFVPAITTRVSDLAPKSQRSLIMGTVVQAMMLAMFASTFVEPILRMFYGLQPATFLFNFGGACFAIATLISIFWLAVRGNKGKSDTAENI